MSKPNESKTSESGIDEIREHIDEIDMEILRLMETRADMAIKIGRIKKIDAIDILDPKREDDILERMASKTTLDREFIRNLFKSIIRYCRSREI